MMYCLYKQSGKRKILRTDCATKEEAIAYLDSGKRFIFVEDENGNQYSSANILAESKIESKEDVENIRSENKSKFDKYFTDRTKVSESTDTELPGTDTDNSESSPERDN